MFEESAPTIGDNRFHDGPAIYGDYGDRTVIRGNLLDGPGRTAVRFGSPADAVVEGNEITDREAGIDSPYGPIAASTIQGNTISGATSVAISVNGAARVGDNVLSEDRTAITWSGKEGLIERNTITGGENGIVIGSGGPTVQDNTVEGVVGRAVVIAGISSPVLSGNPSGGNGENLSVSDKATPEDDGTNEICEDGAAE